MTESDKNNPKMETKPISEKKSFITINSLIPFQVLKIIPNDDLSEIYLKSRVLSFIKFSFFFSLLSIVMFYFLGIDLPKAVGLSIAVGVAYIFLRIMLSNDEQTKLLSEEVTFKLSERERYKKIADESDELMTKSDKQFESMYVEKIALESIVDDLKDELLSLKQQAKDNEDNSIAIIGKHKAQISEMEHQMEAMSKEIKFLIDSQIKAKVVAYELGVSHTEEINAKKKSLAQTALNPATRAEYEARIENEIPKEREEALFG